MEQRGGGRIINLSTGSGEVFRLAEEPPKLGAVGEFSLTHPAYYASKRGLDLVATELVAIRVEEMGLDPTLAVPMTVPTRMIVYVSACENPAEYTSRLFWAERELADMGIPLD